MVGVIYPPAFSFPLFFVFVFMSLDSKLSSKEPILHSSLFTSFLVYCWILRSLLWFHYIILHYYIAIFHIIISLLSIQYCRYYSFSISIFHFCFQFLNYRLSCVIFSVYHILLWFYYIILHYYIVLYQFISYYFITIVYLVLFLLFYFYFIFHLLLFLFSICK